MKATTLKALKASIAHWRRMATGKRNAGETHLSSCCALCDEFYSQPYCNGCPVAYAGFRYCNANKQGEHSQWLKCDAAYDGFGKDYESPQFKAAATKQLAFLKSLLPTRKKAAKKAVKKGK